MHELPSSVVPCTRRPELVQSLYLVIQLMMLRRQMMFSLNIAAIALVIIMRISAIQLPSLDWVASRYLKLLTFWRCRCRSLLGCQCWWCSGRCSDLHVPALFVSLLVMYWSSFLLPTARSMSSAKCIAYESTTNGEESGSCGRFPCILLFRNMLNSNTHSWQPVFFLSRVVW